MVAKLSGTHDPRKGTVRLTLTRPQGAISWTWTNAEFAEVLIAMVALQEHIEEHLRQSEATKLCRRIESYGGGG